MKCDRENHKEDRINEETAIEADRTILKQMKKRNNERIRTKEKK